MVCPSVLLLPQFPPYCESSPDEPYPHNYVESSSVVVVSSRMLSLRHCTSASRASSHRRSVVPPPSSWDVSAVRVSVLDPDPSPFMSLLDSNSTFHEGLSWHKVDEPNELSNMGHAPDDDETMSVLSSHASTNFSGSLARRLSSGNNGANCCR